MAVSLARGSTLALSVSRLVFTKYFCGRRCISLSETHCAGGKLRVRNRRAADSLRYGPLTDLPDWSYADGRPAPLTINQLKRKEERIHIAQRVVRLLEEVDNIKAKSVKKKEQFKQGNTDV